MALLSPSRVLSPSPSLLCPLRPRITSTAAGPASRNSISTSIISLAIYLLSLCIATPPDLQYIHRHRQRHRQLQRPLPSCPCPRPPPWPSVHPSKPGKSSLFLCPRSPARFSFPTSPDWLGLRLHRTVSSARGDERPSRPSSQRNCRRSIKLEAIIDPRRESRAAADIYTTIVRGHLTTNIPSTPLPMLPSGYRPLPYCSCTHRSPVHAQGHAHHPTPSRRRQPERTKGTGTRRA